MKYMTTRDLIIPCGTVVGEPPTASTRWGSHHEALVEIDKDTTGYLAIDVEEAIEAGFLVENP